LDAWELILAAPRIEHGFIASNSNDSKYSAKRTVGNLRRLADGSPLGDLAGGAIFGAA